METTEIIDTKICKGCRQNLPYSNFWKNPSNKDGYFGKCKSCAERVKDDNALKKQQYLDQNLWTCSSCKQILPLTEDNFYRRRESKTGFQNRCKKCLQKDPARCDRLVNKDSLDYFIKDRFYGAKNRALNKNIDFNISIKYLNDLWIKQEGKCAITGLVMKHSILEGKVKTNLSIDRIDPSKGYIIGNIQLVCNIINVMKSDMSYTDLKYYCNLILHGND